jgi:hypothetical protein
MSDSDLQVRSLGARHLAPTLTQPVDKDPTRFDTRVTMSLDLNDLLRDWPYEPGQLKVRKILGSDDKEKLQLRIDLGVIQMETTGRPDGLRPHGCESLLDYYQERYRIARKKSEPFVLNAEDIGELQQEGIQYYHRYISFFHLGDFLAVIRDTQRNLEMFAFVEQHAEREELSETVIQFTPYVLMMNVRAVASIDVEREDYAVAVQQIEQGMDKIRAFYTEQGMTEAQENSPELGFLAEWLEEVRARQPVTKLERLQREMDQAIASEAYERAAELRDAIRAHSTRKRKG